jgi:hypothetical protein
MRVECHRVGGETNNVNNQSHKNDPVVAKDWSRRLENRDSGSPMRAAAPKDTPIIIFLTPKSDKCLVEQKEKDERVNYDNVTFTLLLFGQSFKIN